jgi:transcriptional regulator with XRE-family HTH domain
MLSFGERIVLLRRRQDMTQRTLGEEAGIHPNTIARLERGKLTDLPGKYVARLAQALGTTADYLLGLSEQETRREDETQPVPRRTSVRTDRYDAPAPAPTPPAKRQRTRKAAPVG